MIVDVRYVFFDLDGTLIDHFEAIHQAYSFAQEKMGLPAATFEKVKATVGGSVPVTMRRLIGPDASNEFVGKATEIFYARFEEIMLDHVTVLDGVPEFLEGLSDRGFHLAVFTNKRGDHARKVLTHLKLSKFFDLIAGAGDTPYRKPQVEFTNWVLAKVEAKPSEALMIGDSPFDVKAGKVRSLRVAAVATGSHSEKELEETEADWVFGDMAKLGETLFGLS
ncbi:MAG: HAD family hydrolase [Verrucomicrobiota bacterium]